MSDSEDLRVERLLGAVQSSRSNVPIVRAVRPDLQSVDSPPHNLLLETTTFVGRENELSRLREKISNPACRLITITGPGGTGKTRLALEAAAEILSLQRVREVPCEFPDGVFTVDLTDYTDPELVMSAVANTLDLHVEEQPPVDIVSNYLQGKRLLLILHTFECLIPAARDVEKLLRTHAGLKVLVTSRHPLGVASEHLIPLDPLPVPVSSSPSNFDAIKDSDAVLLFVERAMKVRPGFSLSSDNASTVAQIVRKLDGLPLAIELAAARMRTLSESVLLSNLERVLPRLADGRIGDPERHQGLHATIGWSYELLSDKDKLLFQRIGVFSGGWTYEAATAVCTFEEVIDVFEGLAVLVDQSLVRWTEGSNGTTRLRMLDTIKEFSWEQLTKSGEVEKLRARHAAYYRDWAEKGETELWGSQHAAVLEQFEQDEENLRQALQWASEAEDTELLLRLAGALGPYWRFLVRDVDGKTWLRAVLDKADDVPRQLLARALAGLIPLGPSAPDRAALANRLEGIIRSADLECHDEATFSLALVDVAPVDANITFEGKIALVQEAINSRCLSQNQLAWAHFHLGNQLKELLKWNEASEALNTALSMADDASNPTAQTQILSGLVSINVLTGQWDRALAMAERHVDLATRHVQRHEMPLAHKNLSWVLIHQGRLREALYHAELGIGFAAERSDTYELIRIERRRVEVLERQRRFELSVPTLKDLIKRDVTHDRPISKATCQGLLGVSYLRQGKLSLAQQTLEESLVDQHIHTRPTILLALGEVALEGLDASKAEGLFEQALDISAGRSHNTAQAQLALTRSAIARSRFDVAAAHASRCHKLAVDNGYDDLLAYLYLLKGNAALDGTVLAWGIGADASLKHYQNACLHALAFNRFLLDEVLEEGTATTLMPIIVKCTSGHPDGIAILQSLHDWWVTGLTANGTPVVEAEEYARERERIVEQPHEPPVRQRLAARLKSPLYE